jgi:patatin-like phospholipase/acyl hydrolase
MNKEKFKKKVKKLQQYKDFITTLSVGSVLSLLIVYKAQREAKKANKKQK